MCLILFAYHTHPKYKLIVAANRDEFYKRRTAPADFWNDQPHILAGRDLEKMGTWMGITTSGRFGALTNYRDPNESGAGKHSRGELVTGVLNYTGNLKEYMVALKQSKHLFPGYNFLAGDVDHLYYYSNIGNELKKLSPGIYGVSNHLLNTGWPKVTKGKEGLKKVLKTGQNDMVNQLFTLLLDSDPSPDHLLPKTGVSLEWERMLSPLFIRSSDYGTRSSTVLLMNEEEIRYVERVNEGEVQNQKDFSIKMA